MAQNQCDGCVAGMALIGIMHYYRGKSHMVCTRNLYQVLYRETNPPTRIEKSAVQASDDAGLRLPWQLPGAGED